jgi:hypothetical protein
LPPENQIRSINRPILVEFATQIRPNKEETAIDPGRASGGHVSRGRKQFAEAQLRKQSHQPKRRRLAAPSPNPGGGIGGAEPLLPRRRRDSATAPADHGVRSARNPRTPPPDQTKADQPNNRRGDPGRIRGEEKKLPRKKNRNFRPCSTSFDLRRCKTYVPLRFPPSWIDRRKKKKKKKKNLRLSLCPSIRSPLLA